MLASLTLMPWESRLIVPNAEASPKRQLCSLRSLAEALADHLGCDPSDQHCLLSTPIMLRSLLAQVDFH